MKWLLMLVMGSVVVLSWGCDALQGEGAEKTTLRLVLSSAQDAENPVSLNGCATSIETVTLTVNDREFRQDVSSDTVVFEVSGLRRGDVRAQATVLSNTGDTLFIGEDRRTVDVEDFGTVDIRLEKVRPVLQVCPDTLTLFRENDYTGTLTVVNRGSRSTGSLADTLLWRAVEPQDCINDACVFVEPSDGVVVVPRPDVLFVGGDFASPEALFAIDFESPSGRAQIYVRVSGFPIGK